MLAAGALGAVGVDAQVLGFDGDVHLFGFGQDGDGGRRGVDASARFGARHPLHPMHTRFELEPGEDAAPGDRRDGLLVAADAGFADLHLFERPAPPLGVALVHAKQIGGEQAGLLAPRAGPHLKDGVAFVGVVLGQQENLDAALEIGQLLRQLGSLRLGQGPHFVIDIGIADQVYQAVDLGLGAAQVLDRPHDRRQLGVLLRQVDEAGRAGRVLFVQPGFQLRVAGHHAVQFLVQAHWFPSGFSPSRRNRRRTMRSMVRHSAVS